MRRSPLSRVLPSAPAGAGSGRLLRGVAGFSLGLLGLVLGCGAAPPAPATLQARAALKAQTGQLAAAAALYDEACAVAPSGPCWLAAADAHSRLGDWAAAAQRAETAASLAPEDPEPVAALAQAQLHQERPEAARDAWRAFTGRAPEQPAGWRALSTLLALLDDLEGAEQALSRAVELAPDDAGAWQRLGSYRQRLGRAVPAARAFEQAVALEPALRDLEPRIMALALDGGDRDLARRSAGRVAGPGAPPGAAGLQVAALMLKREDYLSAANELEAVLAAHPEAHPARLLLAQVLVQVGRGGDALAELDRIPEDAPLFAEALRLRAGLASLGGAFGEAAQLLSRAVVIQPERPQLHQDLARALRAAGRVAEADGVLQDAATRWPQDPELRFQQAMATHDRGDGPAAARAMQAVLELAPRHPGALNYLGFAWAEQGLRLREAEAMIRLALEQRPGDPAITDSLGWVLYRQGRLAEAEQALRAALTEQPDEPEIHFHLAAVLHAAGRGAEADAALQAALRHSPNDRIRRLWRVRWQRLTRPQRPGR